MYSFIQDLTDLQLRVNHILSAQLKSSEFEDSSLLEAMHYSVLLGGKRIRPFLTYATGRMLGVSLTQLDYAAAAIECIHAYSLVHDDLPAMDNDALRRGIPTCHIAFNEAIAILAGDALQAFAYELLTHTPNLSAEQCVMLVRTLAQASGAKGMCLGQSLDLLAENKPIRLDELEKIHNNKTGALISAAVMLGFNCSAFHQNQFLKQQLALYSNTIGLVFQIQDDILDVIGQTEVMGKTVGADVQSDKSTYPKLLGIDKAQQKAQQLHQKTLDILDVIVSSHPDFNIEPLKELAVFTIQRES